MIILESPDLEVAITPQVGGGITRITVKDSGLDVLGEVPWPVTDQPIAGGAARHEPEFLTRYSGGWPLLFPNAGDACDFDGVFHGFHGEGAVTPWEVVSKAADRIVLTRRFDIVPVTMRREMRLDGDLLVMREHLRMTGTRPIEVMWGHHPTLGSDLLAAPIEITSGARKARVCTSHDLAANPLALGSEGKWPVVAGKTGPYDLSRPQEPMASLAYLTDFDGDAWIAVRRLDNRVAVALSWDERRFPCAWLWYELAGNPDEPWLSRTRLIGIEPNTTWPAWGLAKAKQAGGALLTLRPGDELATTLRFQAFTPTGPISGLDDEGRALPVRNPD
ncbi:MAG: hypothetical protein ACOZAM_10055 [Pseudomonadota bacterium]